MTTVTSRALRNHTAEVLRLVATGKRVTITVNGAPVAEIRAAQNVRPQFFSKPELIDLITHHQTDAGLTADLETLARDATDDFEAL